MQELAQRAAEDGGLRFNATDKSRGFYEAIGMGEYAQGGNLFNLTFEQARQWLETSGQKAKGGKPKRKVPEWLAESMEPGDGVFIVKRGEGVKARGRGGKFGRWRTLKGGRPVFISGGVQKGGTYIKRADGGYTKVQAGPGVDPEKVDRLLHDFEAIPDWATEGISTVEMTIMPGYGFEAGGEQFQAAMEYRQDEGAIKIFNANRNLSVLSANNAIYHEVGHDLYGRIEQVTVVEGKREGGTPREWYSSDPKTGMMSLKPEYEAAHKKKYPMSNAIGRWNEARDAGEDGITPYSKAWAKESGWLDETFAEMSQVYFAGWTAGGKKYARAGVRRIGKIHSASNLAEAFVDMMDSFSDRRN
jgi:hypothetical protein